METAARLEPELIAQSVPARGPYSVGRLVFERLVEETQAANLTPAWQMRMVEDDPLNAYASPDGTVYVESGLARLAGTSAGLWAAILSHEIAQVVRRDWARRYLFQKQLEGTGATIVLGDPGLLSGSWTDSNKASADTANFCRQLELEADRDGLMLVVKAGYHPDFVPGVTSPAARTGQRRPQRFVVRDASVLGAARSRTCRRVQQASIDFEHRWPDWHASPGGNPPVVVFADPPSVKKTGSKEWEIQVPMRCQNLVGAVEVVLRADSGAPWESLVSHNFPIVKTMRMKCVNLRDALRREPPSCSPSLICWRNESPPRNGQTSTCSIPAERCWSARTCRSCPARCSSIQSIESTSSWARRTTPSTSLGAGDGGCPRRR